MNNAISPEHVSFTLAESKLIILLKNLQDSLESQSWERVWLIGESQNLCLQLEQAWLRAAGISSVNLAHQNPIKAIDSCLLQSRVSTSFSKLNIVLLANVQTSFLVLGTNFRLLLHCHLSDAQALIWQVALSFNQQAIADLLQIPAIAAMAPNSINLTDADPTVQAQQMQHLWLQLLQLMQSEADSAPSRSIPVSNGRNGQSLTQQAPIISPSRALPTTPYGVWTQPPVTDSLKPLLQHAPIGILYESLDGAILRANPAFCRLIGYTEKQLHHLDRRAIAHPEDFAAEMKAIRQLIEGQASERTLKKRFLCQDGSLILTEVTLSIVGELDAEDSYLLTFVTDLSDRQRAEQEIHQRRERETLLSDISATMRTTLDVKQILQIAVQRLRQALGTDRVLAYQLLPDQSGTCIAEDVEPLYPAMLDQAYPADCIPPPYLEAYRLGRIWTVTNIDNHDLADCHRTMLNQVQVRSMIAVAIQRADEALEPQKLTLWGLLVVHHCRSPREWLPDEQQLVQAIANQVAIALEQANLLQQLQLYTQALEDRVHQRTQALERSLQFEQLVRRLTETLRKSPHENEVLQQAVEGLVNVLAVDGCYASLLDSSGNSLKIGFESWRNRSTPKVASQSLLPTWSSEMRQQLTAGECITQEQQTATDTYSQLISPILDDQGLMGILAIAQIGSRSWEAAEVSLVEQIASQCAIALRQAQLYRQEHQQRASAEYFRLFLEKSVDVFVEYDRELRYISINPAGEALLGRSLPQILGRTNLELCGAPGELIERLVNQAFQTNEPVFVDHEMLLPTGGKLFETIYTPIVGSDGEVERVIGICRDITDFRHQWHLLETQNHELAETSRLKEEFIANTSHELRTPLTAILGFSNVLLQEFFGSLNEKQKDYLERIHSSGQHLLDLINDILDLSRLEAERLELEPQHVFIIDICESVISLIQERAESQNLRLKIDVEPNLEDMIVDPRRLKQMLLNLLTNAVKFTPSGTVGLKIYRASSVQLEGVMDRINFMVWDTGIGIAKPDQARLFAPFSQIDSSLSRQHSGTGLGLVITRKLAELHGGTITLDSEQGGGSRFILSLPLQQPSQP